MTGLGEGDCPLAAQHGADKGVIPWAVFCSRCGNQNHDLYDGVLDCGHSLDDGASLVDADELRLIEQERAA
jgi:hypothetical protein